MKRKAPSPLRSTKPQERLTATFAREVAAILGPIFTAYGFTKEKLRKDNTSASCLYGKGTAYIELTLSLHPLDYPQSGHVVLGDGLRDWPEKDWNAVALSQLAQALPVLTPVSDYRLDAFSDVSALVAQMRKDLELVGADFLRGDVRVFKRVRADVNRGRDPYKIHHPNGDGTYQTEGDPESAALQKRFS